MATCAVARKLIARTWVTITTGSAYEMRDLDGNPISRRTAKTLARSLAVPDDVRRRTRSHTISTRRGRLAS